jgi:phage shock protein A
MRYNDWAQATEQQRQKLEQARADNERLKEQIEKLEQTNKELTEKLEAFQYALQHARVVNELYQTEATVSTGVGLSDTPEQTEGFFDTLREAMHELDCALTYAE